MKNDNRERYRKSAHTVLDIQYHYVWKTKYSYKILRGDIALRLSELLREICTGRDIITIKGIRSNHVHIPVKAPSYLLPAKIAEYLKGLTAHRLMKEFSELGKRYWGCHLWAK